MEGVAHSDELSPDSEVPFSSTGSFSVFQLID